MARIDLNGGQGNRYQQKQKQNSWFVGVEGAAGDTLTAIANLGREV